MNDMASRRWLGGDTALGGLLLLLGTLVLLGQALDPQMGEVGWPFFVVVVGLGGRWDGAASRYGLAAVLILAGLVLLGRRLLGRRLLAAGRSWVVSG